MSELDEYFKEIVEHDLPTVEQVVKEAAEYNASMKSMYDSIFGGKRK